MSSAKQGLLRQHSRQTLVIFGCFDKALPCVDLDGAGVGNATVCALLYRSGAKY
jgi:hypothetical protein